MANVGYSSVTTYLLNFVTNLRAKQFYLSLKIGSIPPELCVRAAKELKPGAE
jgi:hypothetical protein